MKVESTVALKPYNTFGLAVSAQQMIRMNHLQEAQEAVGYARQQDLPFMILGGGSNVLFRSTYPGLILKNQLPGKSLIKEDQQHVWVRLGAGENWHQCVLWAIENGWGGIENLSLIPGTVGAAPMQNIGAYGVELEQIFDSLEALELSSGNIHSFNRAQCSFGYRSSVFKTSLKGQFLITSVVLRLDKSHKFNTSYGAVEETLTDMGVEQLSIKALSDAIIRIRSSKLPDPQNIGNAGSFFKNPVISQEQFKKLQAIHPQIPGYNLEEGQVKVPAGWLIEQCGWKGLRRGSIGVHQNQALVLVNFGSGEGSEIYQLALDIQQSVKDKFDIHITPEVNII